MRFPIVFQGKDKAMKSEGLSIDLHNKIVVRVQEHALVWRVPRSTGATVIVRREKFKTTRTPPRVGRQPKLSNQAEGPLWRVYSEFAMCHLKKRKEIIRFGEAKQGTRQALLITCLTVKHAGDGIVLMGEGGRELLSGRGQERLVTTGRLNYSNTVKKRCAPRFRTPRPWQLFTFSNDPRPKRPISPTEHHK